MLVTVGRWILGLVCIAISLVFIEQVLGLLFIERIAAKAVDPSSQIRTPFSVRLVGAAAARLHREVLDEPLKPDGTNWPSGFRWFFALEIIGLTGIAVAFMQVGAACFRKSLKWRVEARTILLTSILILISGILLLKTIPARPTVTPPPTPVYDVEFMSQMAAPPNDAFPIDEIGPLVEPAEFDLPTVAPTTDAETERPSRLDLP